ncbi:hypothetical protein O988_08655 [Pseudogymnoascus sp. VKM F-3808]|nr:hypothetical protein O988_08655 [Pseudogymnoascus sp. VKM F-3808]
MASRDASPSPSPWRWPSLSKDRLLTLLAADLLLLTSVLTTLLLPHIPSPLLYPVWGLAKTYAIYLQVLILPCLLGMWGAVKVCTFSPSSPSHFPSPHHVSHRRHEIEPPN